MTHEEKVVLVKKWRDKVLMEQGVIPKYFIETGTCTGAMVEAQKHNFEIVISIEIVEKFHNESYDRFLNDGNVFLYKGDSADLIKHFVNLDDWVVYWLDAHHSGGETSDEHFPLIEEVQAIKDGGRRCVILIDDYGCFSGWVDNIRQIVGEQVPITVHDNTVICVTI